MNFLFQTFRVDCNCVCCWPAVPSHCWPARPKSEQQRRQKWRYQPEEDMKKMNCITISSIHHLWHSPTVCGLFVTSVAALMRYHLSALMRYHLLSFLRLLLYSGNLTLTNLKVHWLAWISHICWSSVLTRYWNPRLDQEEAMVFPYENLLGTPAPLIQTRTIWMLITCVASFPALTEPNILNSQLWKFEGLLKHERRCLLTSEVWTPTNRFLLSHISEVWTLKLERRGAASWPRRAPPLTALPRREMIGSRPFVQVPSSRDGIGLHRLAPAVAKDGKRKSQSRLQPCSPAAARSVPASIVAAGGEIGAECC
jgi:hypothetical protein